MRIIHIGNVNRIANGVGQVISKLAAAQRQLGHEVITLTAIVKHDELPEFTEIHSKNDFCQLIESFRPDIFIFHSLYKFEYIKFYPFLVKRNIPYLITLHGALSLENYRNNHLKKWLANQFFFKKFLKKARTIIYLNKAEKEKSIVPLINPRSAVIPNGCTINTSLNFIEESAHSENKPLRILYIGRIDIYHKALDILTDSIKSYLINKDNPETDFIFYGIGDKREIQSFESMLSPPNRNIRFLGGIYGEEKDNAYRQADIFILTSKSEGMPMGILEALSFGLPCIVTPNTNMADIIKKYDCGWVVDCDKESVLYGLEKAVKDYQARPVALQKNALEASKHFSWHSIALKSIELYKEFI